MNGIKSINGYPLVDEEARKKLSEYSSTIVDTMTGAACATDIAADAPLQGLTLFGKTTQDGTPTPEAPVPLVNAGDGGNIEVKVLGKNLLPYPYEQDGGTYSGITFAVNADGSVSVSGISTADYVSFFPVNDMHLPSGKYKLGNSDVVAVNINQNMRDTGAYVRTVASPGKTFDTSEWDYELYKYSLLLQVTASGTTVNQTVYPMIYHADIADSAFEPYKSGDSLTINTPNGLPGIPVASGGNYTDQSGQQWICDEIDLERGVYVQRCLLVKPLRVSTQNGFASYYIETGKKLIGNATKAALCNVTGNYNYAYGYDSTHYYAETGGNVWAFISESFTGTVEVLCAMAVPIEHPIPTGELPDYRALHTIKPNTTVYNDASAGMTVKYAADTKGYIDQKIAAIAAAVL